MTQRDRLTITLAPGQRAELERIANANGVKLAHVIRYALRDFLNRQINPQLDLQFPPISSLQARQEEESREQR